MIFRVPHPQHVFKTSKKQQVNVVFAEVLKITWYVKDI
ncbi:MAG: hypothetical protein ACI8QG_000346, partial [Flavobacteriales bacterium]